MVTSKLYLAMLRARRFNEFPNEGTHAMYVSCVELMVLPVEPHKVGEHLVDVSVFSTYFFLFSFLPTPLFVSLPVSVLLHSLNKVS